MNNVRYASFIRAGGVAGLISAAILLINAAKRAMLIPTADVTQLLAPIAEVAAILFVLGLLLWSGLRGRLPVVATAANVIALALLVGVEFVINLVFANVDTATTQALLAGPAGIALAATSIGYLGATILLVAAFWSRSPRWALLTYGVGAAIVSLRTFVPELALDIALVLMALGITGLSTRLITFTQPAATAA